MKIGFIGLGNMGFPMALNLQKAGFEVYGKNRSADRERKFAEQGGQTGLSISELASEMDIVITCLPMPNDVEEVYAGENGLFASGREGLILIDCSTVSPELSRQLYLQAQQANIDFLDAPVSGGTIGAAAGTLSIMVGGKEVTFGKANDVLQAIGQDIHYIGPCGSGSAFKLINQLMVAIHTQAVSEAFALAKHMGLDLDLLFKILNQSFAQSRIMERHYTQFMVKESFTPGFALKLLAKDLNLVAEMATASGVNLQAGKNVQALLNKVVGSEFGELDMSGLYPYYLEHGTKENKSRKIKHYAVFLRMLDPEKSVLYREEHLRFLGERRADGMLMANGRFVDGAGGLVIYKATSYEEAEHWVKQDPYIVKGARQYDIHEWDIVLAN
ncbi:MAG: NAD-binding protein [Gorillibacterium sp.]|nr:NAD-binding protein [Gorillibacterium sp.]